MQTRANHSRASALECGSPPPLLHPAGNFQSGRELPHSRTLARRLHPSRPTKLRPAVVACLLLTFLVSWRSVVEASAPATLARLPHTNLLVFHSRKGAVAPVKSKADWQQRRAEILRGMQEVMGPLPGWEKWCPFDMQTREQTNCGSYTRLLITYASDPGSRVPAYLLIPNQAIGGKKKLPAILALHPTDMKYGHRVLVEQLRANYRAYGRDLAERGYVVIAPAYPIMADYQPDLKALGYHSGTMKAIRDNMRALDLLETLPFVRKGRYGAIGHSLGGHNAIFTAVFDPRICVVVSSCGFDSFSDYYDGDPKSWELEHGWCQTRYMPRLADYRGRLADIPFDFYELIAALAPRPVFVNAPLRDDNFRQQSVDAILTAASGVYRLYHVPKVLQAAYPDCEHDFPPEVRETAYRFLDQHLR
jgi:dienelactone hydrolase